MNLLDLHKEQVLSLCVKHKVRQLSAFGSVLRDDFTIESDIDLVVLFDDIDLKDYADNYFELKFALEEIFDKKIDLLEKQAIKNPYFLQQINDQSQLIYAS